MNLYDNLPAFFQDTGKALQAMHMRLALLADGAGRSEGDKALLDAVAAAQTLMSEYAYDLAGHIAAAYRRGSELPERTA